MAMRKNRRGRGLGIYRPPEAFDVNPATRPLPRSSVGETAGESMTPSSISASGYGESMKRTKRRKKQGGVFGVYS